MGGYLGVRWRARVIEQQELRLLLDECIAVLARADQKRGAAYVTFVREDTNTTDEGRRVLNDFRGELSLTEQLANRLQVRTPFGSRVSSSFDAALAALGEVSIAGGVAVSLPPDNLSENLDLHGRMREGEEDL